MAGFKLRSQSVKTRGVIRDNRALTKTQADS